jgi:hypothetical protein
LGAAAPADAVAPIGMAISSAPKTPRSAAGLLGEYGSAKLVVSPIPELLRGNGVPALMPALLPAFMGARPWRTGLLRAVGLLREAPVRLTFPPPLLPD